MLEQGRLRLVKVDSDNLSRFPANPVERSIQKTLLSLTPMEVHVRNLYVNEKLSFKDIARGLGYSVTHVKRIRKGILRQVHDGLYFDWNQGLIPNSRSQ